MTPQEIIYLASLHRFINGGISWEQYVEFSKDWQFISYHGGVVMQKDNEVHCGALAGVHGRWLTRKFIRQIFEPIIYTYGYAKTVAFENDINKEFIERLGFQLVRVQDGLAYYEMYHVPYSKRGDVCQ